MIALLALATLAPSLDCKAVVNQIDMAQCALIEYHNADDELNRRWKITVAAVKNSGGGAVSAEQSLKYLLSAQRSWVAFREAHCDSAYPYTMRAQLDYTQNVWCQTELTRARIDQLREVEEAYGN